MPKTLNLDGQKKLLDELADRNPVPYNKTTFTSFEQWAEEAKKVTNPDQARHILYYGFQPLYDAVITNEVNSVKGKRKKALAALDKVMTAGIEYLTGYYLGKPETNIINKLATDIEDVVKGVHYYYKTRNIDYNGISTKDINRFIRTYIEKIKEAGIPAPDTVIGCACGSAEIVMPLAGILGAKLEFIRRSKRRNDDKALLIKEQATRIKKSVSGKSVVCVEDYVCTAQSLYEVMIKTKKFKPVSLFGAGVNGDSSDVNDMTVEMSEKKFNLFALTK
jgi:hypothetical protein